MLSIQTIALWPAEWIVRLILMLFGIELEQLPHDSQVISVGVVALAGWAHIAKLILGVIQRRVFGHYGNGG